METLNIEQLKEKLTKNYTEEFITEFYKNYIINNDNIPQDIKIDFLRLFSRNYKLMNLSRKDIKQIMNFYKILESKMIEKLGNTDSGVIFYLIAIRMNLELDLHRALIVEPENSIISYLGQYI